MTKTNDTIFAPATPQGKSAVAVVRISGPHAAAALSELMPQTAAPPAPRRATYTPLLDGDGAMLDHALVLFFPAPNSATGEDVAELHLHGAPALMRLMLRRLGRMKNLRPALAGEFTRRAFAHGRIDLAEAEAIGDIIDADTSAQHRAAIAQLDGRLGRATEGWREQIIALAARLEALVDFADEELPAGLEAELQKGIAQLITDMDTALANAGAGILNRDGITIAILGRPNAGKSTLLNALAGEQRAIVSPHAGTTRDLVRVDMDIAGLAVHLVDMAGIHAETQSIENKRKKDALSGLDAVEAEGIRRALELAAIAPIVLVLVEATTATPPAATMQSLLKALGQTAPTRPRIIPILSKFDLCGEGNTPDIPPDWVKLSATKRLGMDELHTAIATALMEIAPQGGGEAALLTRARHRDSVMAARDALARAADISPATAPELMAEEFRAAATALGRITGRVDAEDVLDAIFASFCIGK